MMDNFAANCPYHLLTQKGKTYDEMQNEFAAACPYFTRRNIVFSTVAARAQGPPGRGSPPEAASPGLEEEPSKGSTSTATPRRDRLKTSRAPA